LAVPMAMGSVSRRASRRTRRPLAVICASVALGLCALASRPGLSHAVHHEADHVSPPGEGGIMHLLCGDVYRTIFWPLLVATAGLAWRTRPKVEAALPPGFSSYQRRYLIVWSLAVAADWLQGLMPQSIQMIPTHEVTCFPVGEQEKCAQLPQISYPMLGSVAALLCAELGPNALADVMKAYLQESPNCRNAVLPRKHAFRLLQAVHVMVLYAGSCVTKHSGAPVSVLGGISTSLLFSTFESGVLDGSELNRFTALRPWLVQSPSIDVVLLARESNEQRFWHIWQPEFSCQSRCGSAPYEALCVLVSDIRRSELDDKIVESSIWHYGGYTAPFDISLVCLLLAIPAIQMTWTENYGDNKAGGEGAGIVSSLRAGARAMGSNWQVPVLGLAVAAFEGSMYCFVFNWTPALDAGGGPPPPHGLIFSSFMMACMCGSSFFGMLDSSYRPVKVLLPVIVAAAAALGLIGFSLARGSTSNAAIFAGFLIFEACVGAYFPCMGTVKSQVVPEDARAGVYNVYRVPLNFFVIFLLLTDISLPMQFGACCCLLLVAAGAVVLIGRAGQTR
ncbi:unnamed protein product, partial [Polarella glacialis]